MLFKRAEVTSAFLKMGLMGFAGSGKTYTATDTAIGLVLLMRELGVEHGDRPMEITAETGSPRDMDLAAFARDGFLDFRHESHGTRFIDAIDAKRQADAGMKQAAEHANDVHAGWTDEAYSFLLSFARTHETFISEDVSGASKNSALPQSPTDRAWGRVYRRAAAAGIIVKDGTGISLRRHGSVCPRWRSKIWSKQ